MKISTLIIEDEPLARQTLLEFCGEYVRLEIVGEAADGACALEKLRALKPALIFLDVQMPELGGIEVLRRVKAETGATPAIVFTTAFDDYAIAAFEFEAVDYLQKPFGRERFRQTIERVQRRFDEKQLQSQPEQTIENPILTRLFVRDNKRIVPILVKHIVRLEAADDYTIVFAHDKRFVVNSAIGELASTLR